MSTININKGLIGAEDLYSGANATFTRRKSDGTSQTMTKALLGTWTHNVKNYGAVGDGTTDDTAAVLSALDAAKTAVAGGGRGTVYFPDGEYYIPTLLNYAQTQDLTLVGSHRDQVVLDGGDLTPVASEMVFTGGASFSARGITFKDMPAVINYSAVMATIDHVDIQDCAFDGVGAACYWNNPLGPTAILTSLNFSGNTVKDSNRGCQMRPYSLLKGVARDNVLTDTVSRAITMGFDTSDSSLVSGAYVVSGNYIDGVTEDPAASTGAGANGIELFGYHVRVTDNYVANVTSIAGTDSEGIYIKSRFAIVANNNLLDAGEKEAMINVKGDARESVSPDKPDGFTTIIRGNTLRRVSNTAIGIFITTDDCLVEGNQFDGFTLQNIKTHARSLTNLVIRGNVIRNCSAPQMVTVECYGTGVQVVGNSFFESTATTGTVIAILVSTQDNQSLDEVIISGNFIHTMTATSGSGRGIAIGASATQTISGVVVDGNFIDTVDKAINFFGLVAVTDAQVSNNILRNVGDAQGHLEHTSGATYAPTTLKVFNNIGMPLTNDLISHVTGFVR